MRKKIWVIRCISVALNKKIKCERDKLCYVSEVRKILYVVDKINILFNVHNFSGFWDKMKTKIILVYQKFVKLGIDDIQKRRPRVNLTKREN